MLVSPCRAWLGVAAEAPKPLQVMSSQAQGILEGETSAPAYRGADEQAGQDGRIPFLNGRDGRISEGAPRLEAVSVASAAEVVSDLPGTEPARMEPTGHGARDEETAHIISIPCTSQHATNSSNSGSSHSNPRL